MKTLSRSLRKHNVTVEADNLEAGLVDEHHAKGNFEARDKEDPDEDEVSDGD